MAGFRNCTATREVSYTDNLRIAILLLLDFQFGSQSEQMRTESQKRIIRENVKFNKIIMTDFEKNEIDKIKLIEAYIEAGADWVIIGLKDLKKVIDNIDLYKISVN